MRKFYQEVDTNSRNAMVAFLKNHPRYPTANSWNSSTSYSCDLKIHHLDLPRNIEDKLQLMLDTEELADIRTELLENFDRTHAYFWQAAMNGRSGGYLVLYQGCVKNSEYKSYCTQCGQRNYQSATESNNVCGVCGNPTRVNYDKPPLNISCYPFKGTDQGEDFEDWDEYSLKSRVKLVQELDILADNLVKEAVSLANSFNVVETEVVVPIVEKRKVLVPA